MNDKFWVLYRPSNMLHYVYTVMYYRGKLVKFN